MRERQERIEAGEQRADAAERTKASEARRQVIDERVRIARELHDVLAHHITVVNAQAGVAHYLLKSDPDTAEKALAGIIDNTRAALDDLRATLGVLRSDRDDTRAKDPGSPAPGLGQLPALIDSFTTGGAAVTFRSHGAPRSLSGAAELGLYRIAQEALTNAAKHAPGAAVELTLDWTDATVSLRVTNTEPPTPSPRPAAGGTGHGLTGMMDIRMPELDGIQATRAITAERDLESVKILILTTFETEELIIDALRAGASGYLGKGVEPAALLDAIRTVVAGQALLSPAATRALVSRVVSQPRAGHAADPKALQMLTPRELEILTLVGLGLSNDDIAARLVIRPATAKTHVNRTMMKLGARDRAQLVIAAYETGLITPGQRSG